MIKLDKHVKGLENALTSVKEQIKLLEKQQKAIEMNAEKENRFLTKAEEKNWDSIDEQISILMDEEDAIECALDYLREYCE